MLLTDTKLCVSLLLGVLQAHQLIPDCWLVKTRTLSMGEIVPLANKHA